jgi:hypothetical protein
MSKDSAVNLKLRGVSVGMLAGLECARPNSCDMPPVANAVFSERTAAHHATTPVQESDVLRQFPPWLLNSRVVMECVQSGHLNMEKPFIHFDGV